MQRWFRVSAALADTFLAARRRRCRTRCLRGAGAPAEILASALGSKRQSPGLQRRALTSCRRRKDGLGPKRVEPERIRRRLAVDRSACIVSPNSVSAFVFLGCMFKSLIRGETADLFWSTRCKRTKVYSQYEQKRMDQKMVLLAIIIIIIRKLKQWDTNKTVQ